MLIPRGHLIHLTWGHSARRTREWQMAENVSNLMRALVGLCDTLLARYTTGTITRNGAGESTGRSSEKWSERASSLPRGVGIGTTGGIQDRSGHRLGRCTSQSVPTHLQQFGPPEAHLVMVLSMFKGVLNVELHQLPKLVHPCLCFESRCPLNLLDCKDRRPRHLDDDRGDPTMEAVDCPGSHTRWKREICGAMNIQLMFMYSNHHGGDRPWMFKKGCFSDVLDISVC
ncbi:hypothetical protein BJ742DRAFT_7798 [Cladochytrium replicatum]|nr:hypothetical protein BJ742DRAFT_7798 [Cladochytrium replicatum]